MNTKEKIIETIIEILNEEMFNYGEAITMRNKDEVFDRTCDKIQKLFKQEKTDKIKCKISPIYSKDNNKELHFYCEFCGNEMEYNEDRICPLRDEENIEYKIDKILKYYELDDVGINIGGARKDLVKLFNQTLNK